MFSLGKKVRKGVAVGVLPFITLTAETALAACTDTDIQLTISQGISIGKVVVPDSGSSQIGIAPNGSRTIPSNLSFGPNNNQNHGNQFQSAVLDITGTPNCNFRIYVGVTPARISNVTLLGVGGTSLDSTTSGAKGQLSSTGTAKVNLGASVTVTSGDSGTILESFDVTVELVNT